MWNKKEETHSVSSFFSCLWLIVMGILQDHILDLHQPGNIGRYAAFAAGFYR